LATTETNQKMGFGLRKSEAPPPVTSAPARPKPSTAELVRDNKRDISRAQRELDRELQNLKREEARIMSEVKRLGAAGQTTAARMAAKSLVANRKQQEKLVAGRYQMGGVSAQMTTMKATAAMTEAMGKAGDVMGKMNQAAGLQGMMGNVKEYEKQTEKLNMTEEMMGDAIDGALDADGVDEESDEVLASVLDEIGMDVKGKMSVAPTARPAAPTAEASATSDAEVDALMKRLQGL